MRLDQTIKAELFDWQVSSTYFCSDSTAVIQGIYNCTKRFPVFVANRMAEIERYTEINSWRYVPSKQNPADCLSKGLTTIQLLKSSSWLCGPAFLSKPPSQWPPQLAKLVDLSLEFLLYERRERVFSVLDATSSEQRLPANALISAFSSLYRLKRAVGWWRRYFVFLRLKVKGKLVGDHHVFRKELAVEEFKQAEMSLLRYTQRQEFSEAFDPSARSSSKQLLHLNTFIKEGILRVGGRLSNASVGYDARHPCILPGRSHFAKLVIKQYHQQAGHSSLMHTMSLLKGKYWVLKGLSAVRKVIDDCVVCSRQNALPGKQLMADVPSSRLQVSLPPFFHTGVDYFGPFTVKQGRSRVKRYGCIYLHDNKSSPS